MAETQTQTLHAGFARESGFPTGRGRAPPAEPCPGSHSQGKPGLPAVGPPLEPYQGKVPHPQAAWAHHPRPTCPQVWFHPWESDSGVLFLSPPAHPPDTPAGF